MWGQASSGRWAHNRINWAFYDTKNFTNTFPLPIIGAPGKLGDNDPGKQSDRTYETRYPGNEGIGGGFLCPVFFNEFS